MRIIAALIASLPLILSAELSYDHELEILSAFFDQAEPDTPEYNLHQYCKDLIRKNAPREQIGQILYLYDNNPTNALSLIDSADPVGSKSRTKVAFAKAMNELNQKLILLRVDHQRALLQNSTSIIQEALPKAISHALITSTGFANVAIAQEIKKYLVPLPTLAYQQDIARVLDLLTEISADPAQLTEWNNLLSSVTKPKDPKSPSLNLIRACLNLSPTINVTDQHAKEVFLYSFLGHARQGHSGHCFEEWWQIVVKDGLWHTIAKDSTEILKYGALIRTINGVEDSFPYVYAIEDEDLKKVSLIDYEGNLRGGVNIFDAPGIKAAALQMNLTNLSMFKEEALSQFVKTETDNPITPEELIETLAQLSIAHKQNGIYQQEDLVNLGLFAFSAQTTCAPLEMYENCLASFAETLDGDYVRGMTLNAVEAALDSQWLKGVFPWQIPSIQSLKKQFFDTFSAQFEILYNPRVEFATPSADGSSAASAFEMHRINGQKITTPDDFQRMALDICSLVKRTIQQTDERSLLGQKERKCKLATLDKIAAYIGLDQTFLKLTLWNYNPENKNMSDPVNNWKKLAHLPWLGHAHGHEEEVMQDVYYLRK
jgi:hypothetical protein